MKQHIYGIVLFIFSIACLNASAACYPTNPTWNNFNLPSQSNQFEIKFVAVARKPNMDAVVGFSNGAGTHFNHYASLIRFNTSGNIDVRNGDNYAADQIISYSTTSVFRFRVLVNLQSKTYSVYVVRSNLPEVRIANNYAFRTEQSQVAAINNYGLWSSAADMSLYVCQVVVSTPTESTVNGLIVDRNHASASDSNPGTETLPLKTLTRAGSIAKAGDTVYVKAGAYTEMLNVANSGTESAPIQFKAYPGHECKRPSDPLAAPSCQVSLLNSVNINEKSFIRIEGFEMKNHGNAGVWCQGRDREMSHHISILNNYIHDLGGYGIECRNARQTLIEDNFIQNIRSYAGIGIRGDREERDVTIRKNTVLHVDCDGIHIEGVNILVENNHLGSSFHTDCHQDALEVYGPVDGLIIRNNRIWDWTQNIYLSAETNYLRNITVQGNMVWCDQYCALGNDAPGVNAGPNVADITNLKIENNTFHNVWNMITDGYARSTNYWITGLTVVNNIFSKSRLSVEIHHPYESDYNLFYNSVIAGKTSLAAFRALGTGKEINSIEANPLFKGVFDFHIDPLSPAIGRGKSMPTSSYDLDGQLRVQGTRLDIGADEVP